LFYVRVSAAAVMTVILLQSSVLTVLEVLLFDPLSDWRLAFAKKSKQQQKEGRAGHA
jgi:hypothetical protein